MTIFYQRLKELCDIKNIFISNVEAGVGVTKNTAGNWKKTIPLAETVVKVSIYLGVSTDYLLGLTDDPSPSKTQLSSETRFIMNICESNPTVASAIVDLINNLRTV